MILRHIHLPGLTTYTTAAKLQNNLFSALLTHKASPTTIAANPPTVLTAQFSPVYTCGRREIGNVTPTQQAFLREPQASGARAEFHEALRGGQTTFHGPGQLVAYPILDLKRHGLSARCYVHLLEDVVMETCAHYGIKTKRTEHAGVWFDADRKICAIGVHLRRNVSCHGIGLNVGTDLGWFKRIVACGLEDKTATSFEEVGVKGVAVEEVADVFVKMLGERLGDVDAVETIDGHGLIEEISGE